MGVVWHALGMIGVSSLSFADLTEASFLLRVGLVALFTVIVCVASAITQRRSQRALIKELTATFDERFSEKVLLEKLTATLDERYVRRDDKTQEFLNQRCATMEGLLSYVRPRRCDRRTRSA